MPSGPGNQGHEQRACQDVVLYRRPLFSAGQLLEQEEFEEDLAHEQLKKTQQCKEGVAWKSAGRVLAMPIAADGITMADITKIVSRAPNSFFMWVPWILVLIAVILLLLFFTTHTQGEFGSNVLVKGEPEHSDHNSDGYNPTGD